MLKLNSMTLKLNFANIKLNFTSKIKILHSAKYCISDLYKSSEGFSVFFLFI